MLTTRPRASDLGAVKVILAAIQPKSLGKPRLPNCATRTSPSRHGVENILRPRLNVTRDDFWNLHAKHDRPAKQEAQIKTTNVVTDKAGHADLR